MRYRPLASHIPLETVRPQQRLSAPLPSRPQPPAAAPAQVFAQARATLPTATHESSSSSSSRRLDSTDPCVPQGVSEGLRAILHTAPTTCDQCLHGPAHLHQRYVALLLTLSAVLHRPHGDLGAAGSARQPTSTSAVPCLRQRQRRWAFTWPLDADRTAAGTYTPASTRSFVPTHLREVLPCSSPIPYTSPIASHSYGGKRGRSRLYHRPSS